MWTAEIELAPGVSLLKRYSARTPFEALAYAVRLFGLRARVRPA
jgi:hypothetical protein